VTVCTYARTRKGEKGPERNVGGSKKVVWKKAQGLQEGKGGQKAKGKRKQNERSLRKAEGKGVRKKQRICVKKKFWRNAPKPRVAVKEVDKRCRQSDHPRVSNGNTKKKKSE